MLCPAVSMETITWLLEAVGRLSVVSFAVMAVTSCFTWWFCTFCVLILMLCQWQVILACWRAQCRVICFLGERYTQVTSGLVKIEEPTFAHRKHKLCLLWKVDCHCSGDSADITVSPLASTPLAMRHRNGFSALKNPRLSRA